MKKQFLRVPTSMNTLSVNHLSTRLQPYLYPIDDRLFTMSLYNTVHVAHDIYEPNPTGTLFSPLTNACL